MRKKDKTNKICGHSLITKSIIYNILEKWSLILSLKVEHTQG